MRVTVLNCNTMHDHGTERRGHDLFHIVPLVSVCSSQHGLKQIKPCFNARDGCEAALRSDGRLYLQSYYLLNIG